MEEVDEDVCGGWVGVGGMNGLCGNVRVQPIVYQHFE